MKELTQSEEECNQYIAARDDLAYFSSYRLPTRALSQTINERETAKEELKAARMTDDSRGELRSSLLDQS